MSTPYNSYALAIGSHAGEYPVVDRFPDALLEAYHLAEKESVTVLRINRRGESIEFIPICTVSPPVAPTHSTSPKEVTA